jgi:hypothetical protein
VKKGVIEFTLTVMIVLMSAATVVAAQSSLESYKTIFSEKAKLMLDYSKDFRSVSFRSFAMGEKDSFECQITMQLSNIALMNQERLTTLCDLITICETCASKEEMIVKPIIKGRLDLYIERMQNEIEQVGTALRYAKRPEVIASVRRFREELQGIEKLFKSIPCAVHE